MCWLRCRCESARGQKSVKKTSSPMGPPDTTRVWGKVNPPDNSWAKTAPVKGQVEPLKAVHPPVRPAMAVRAQERERLASILDLAAPHEEYLASAIALWLRSGEHEAI